MRELMRAMVASIMLRSRCKTTLRLARQFRFHGAEEFHITAMEL
jgi:hypothetical protein